MDIEAIRLVIKVTKKQAVIVPGMAEIDKDTFITFESVTCYVTPSSYI